MKILDTIKITFSNYALILKILLTYLLVIAIVVGLASASMSATISSVADAINKTGVLVNVQLLISEMFGKFNEMAFQQSLQNVIISIQEALSIIPNFYSRVTFAYISFFVAIAAGKYFVSYGDIPYFSCLNNFMTTSSKGRYTWNYFKNFKKSTIYGLILIAITVPLDTLLIIGVAGMYLTIFAPFGVVGLIITILIAMVLFTVRIVMFSMWLPNLTNQNLSVIESLKAGFKQVVDLFWKVFLNNLVVVSICVAVLVPIVIFTPLIAAIILTVIIVLFTSFIMKSLNMTIYFSNKNLRYFTKSIKFDSIDKKTL